MKPPNKHSLTAGMSGMGKSVQAVENAVRDADRGNSALVIEDGHPRSMAAAAFEKLVARGHGHRILYDRLYETNPVVGYEFIRPSKSKDPLLRRAENDLQIRNFVDILLRRRDQQSLATSPYTETWSLNALKLFIEQDRPKTLDKLHRLLVPGSKELQESLDDCREPEFVEPMQQLYDGHIPAIQYGSAYRLFSAVCTSPAFALRCTPTFDFDSFLRNKGILIVEGGSFGTLSQDSVRIMLGAISLRSIEYVRNRPRPYPHVSHYMDEATNVGLVGDAECRALMELRKENYALHLTVQNLNFPTAAITESVLTNCGTHYWFGVGSSKLAQVGAADLGDPELKNTLLNLSVGECFVKVPGSYRRIRVQMSDDPWTFPGLSAKKAELALQNMKQRPEYRRRSIGSVTPSSNDACKSTPASRATSSTSSPVHRLRTAALPNKEDGGTSNCEAP